jgi:hypothetical protein
MAMFNNLPSGFGSTPNPETVTRQTTAVSAPVAAPKPPLPVAAPKPAAAPVVAPKPAAPAPAAKPATPAPTAAPTAAPAAPGTGSSTTTTTTKISGSTVQEGLANLIGRDAQGNAINPVLKQAENRQLQAFNDRGLLNTSMAMQAAQEAVISKGLEIVKPDVEMAFTTRRDYTDKVADISANFQRQLDTINASNMSPEDKSVAIAQAQQQRDGELVYMNNLYAKMPTWEAQWLTSAVPMAGVNPSSISNRDTLSNIVNDPAQPQATRDAALARLRALNSGAGGGGGDDGTGLGSAGKAANGYNLPTTISGVGAVNWNGRPPGPLSMYRTMREAYDAYARSGGNMSPADWYKKQNQGISGSDNSSGEAGGPGGGGGGGDSGGISI